MSKYTLLILCFLASLLPNAGCHQKTKGFNYEQHKREDSERIKETRKRNKKNKSLLHFKGKSVKQRKPELP